MRNIISSRTDIEYLILFLLIAICFFFSLKRKKNVCHVKSFCIDKDFSIIMKGIACLFILFGHYGQRRAMLLPDAGLVSTATWNLTANIGLVWFMFFSGYGLSLSKIDNTFCAWKHRLLKVYLPLLFVSLLTLILYFILPNKFSAEDAKILWISPHIEALHSGNYGQIIPFLFGWPDWYVFCIMILYSIFYLSFWISHKTNKSQTIILSIFLLIYFIFAYLYFGPPQAHWYRFIWVFLLGHIVAKQNMLSFNKSLLLLAPFLCVIFLDGKIMLLSYFIGFYSLLVASIISKYYNVKSKSVLLFLGGGYIIFLLFDPCPYRISYYYILGYQ